MLKYVNECRRILEQHGFKFKKTDKLNKRTIMVRGDITAFIEPNGSVVIADNNRLISFKEVKSSKFSI